ncbi:two-component sensor histidine kinase [Planobispora rosea]|uniref:histidine kinase n=1 Tax=Planobispora rosea TaxID=35762 RepID=A0A8J3WBX0_PLARO|nr:histidine kinase [Planobispora rosea]GGS56060.1 two-component sensor histidine kinase [Planobispora rosea]GIH83600.1 two-component sensor histidine kinase [Planobispora rosea]
MRVPDRVEAAEAGLGAMLAAAVAFQAYQVAVSWGAGHWPFGAVVAASICLLALARRRAPLGTAVAGLAVTALAIPAARFLHLPAEPSPAASLGLAVLTASAVRTLPARTACAVAASGPAVVAGGLLTAPGSAVPVLGGLAWLAGLSLGFGSRLLAARRRAAAERVRHAERLELARELHDVVAHHITSIVLQAQAAQLVTARHPERTAGSLADIETAGARALAATRRVVGLLRDAAPAAEGCERLGELIEGFESHGRRAHLRLDAEPSGWPPHVSGTVYRVVREALTNVSRHAPQARAVTVGITQDERAVTVEVEDDAPRTPVRHHRRAGYGLTGMRERLDTLGGTLTAGPRPGYGWSVRAVIPTGEHR